MSSSDQTGESTILSVVTIAFNDLEGLKGTRLSVQEQSLPGIEHIVVDAASRDGTPDYLARLDDEELVWSSEPDAGRYDGMNKGAAAAQGKYIWFMHASDRFASPESAAVAVRALEASDRRWAFGFSRIVREGSVVGFGGYIPFNRRRFLLGGKVIPHQASLFERKFFLDLGGYTDRFGVADDQRFFVRAAAAEDPLVVPEFLCDFDAQGIGTTRGIWPHYRDMCRARHRESASATGSLIVDDVLTLGLWAKQAVKYGLRDAIR